jgi:hypothetical protein
LGGGDARPAVRPQAIGGSDGRVLFRLETVDGAPAEPPTFATAVPNWSLGDVIPLGHRALRVIGKRDDGADQPPVLIVEEAS